MRIKLQMRQKGIYFIKTYEEDQGTGHIAIKMKVTNILPCCKVMV